MQIFCKGPAFGLLLLRFSRQAASSVQASTLSQHDGDSYYDSDAREGSTGTEGIVLALKTSSESAEGIFSEASRLGISPQDYEAVFSHSSETRLHPI